MLGSAISTVEDLFESVALNLPCSSVLVKSAAYFYHSDYRDERTKRIGTS